MTNDRFWKSFWLLFTGATLLCMAGSASLFFTHIGNIDTAAVGVDYNPDKDPYETSLHNSSLAPITGGFVYKDALPLSLSPWNWDATLNWRSGEQVYEGSSALKAAFTNQWAGFGIGGLNIDTSANKTLSLAVYPDANVGDLYVELYDKKGNALGRQSLGWYAASGALVANQWQNISIPLQNLMGSSSSSAITALSLSTTNAGTAYVDAIQFTAAPSLHAPWVYVVADGGDGYVEPPYNPFATSTKTSLPYTMTLSPTVDDRWDTVRGLFEQDYDAYRIGPTKGANDAFAFFRSGKAWTDYQVSANVVWGGTRVLSLIVRMKDEKNYTECSFSNGANTIQLYNVQNGNSTMIIQSGTLHYSDYTGGAGTIGMTVRGNTVVCSSLGKRVISWDVENIPSSGTVGLEAWDEDDTLTPHQITSFSVLPFVGE